MQTDFKVDVQFACHLLPVSTKPTHCHSPASQGQGKLHEMWDEQHHQLCVDAQMMLYLKK
jgi:hypothetical protein